MNISKKSRAKGRIELYKSILLVILALACALIGIMLKKYLSPSDSQEGAYPAWNNSEITEDIQTSAGSRFFEYTKSDFTVVTCGESRSFYYESSQRYDSLTNTLNGILNDILVKSEVIGSYQCETDEWTYALSQNSVFLKLPCLIKMSELSAISGLTVNSYMSGAGAFDELALIPDGEQQTISIYFRSGSSGTIQKYETNLSADVLNTVLNSYCGSGRNCAYGFELSREPSAYGMSDAASEAVSLLDISAVIPLSEISAPNVTLGTPLVLSGSLYDLTSSPEIGGIIDLFGIDLSSVRVFCDSEDVKHFEVADPALKIFPDGKIEFSSAAGITNEMFSASDNAAANAFQGVCSIITRLCKSLNINPYGGGASLRLSGIEELGDSVRITFDYRLSGIPLSIAENGYATEATVKEGRLTDFRICLKSFSLSSETATNGTALSVIERLAAENPDIKFNNITLRYDNVSDGEPSHTAWKEK